MTIEEFKKDLELVIKLLENKFTDYYFCIKEHEDEILLVCNFGSLRLRIMFDKDDIRDNISTFYFDISTSYTVVDYVSGQISYGKLKDEIIKVVKFFDSYVQFYN